MDFVLYFLGAVAAAAVAFRYLLRMTTVFEFERGLAYRRGRFRRVLAPGQYLHVPLLSRIDKIDVRQRAVTVPGQEVLTADSVSLKVSLAARFSIADPAAAVNRVQNIEQAFYLVLQLALRTLVGGLTADELLERRAALSADLTEASASEAAALGIELHGVGVKDVMFPGELKRIFTQVVKAKKDGQAALERARGETAALRHLANAARVMENNPALLHLRTLQSLNDGAGHTLVYGVPADAAASRTSPRQPPQNGSAPAD